MSFESAAIFLLNGGSAKDKGVLVSKHKVSDPPQFPIPKIYLTFQNSCPSPAARSCRREIRPFVVMNALFVHLLTVDQVD